MGGRRIPLLDLVGARGPVLSRRARERLLADPDRPSGAAYTGPATLPFPVLPVQVFGVDYDIDLVLVDDHPAWDMHEYARLRTARGDVWLCKDTVAGTLEQTLVADVDGLEHWLPEIPLRRARRPVHVEAHEGGGRIDVRLRYVNLHDEEVEVHVRAPWPGSALGRRNTSTMGHSRDHVLAVLDMPRRSFATGGGISIAGVQRKLARIAGLVPFRVVLRQTQGGFSVGSWRQEARDGGFRTVHASGTAQDWTREDTVDGVAYRQHAEQRDLRYVFRRDGGELLRAEAWPWEGERPACVAHFVPALPDLRRPFRGTWTGRYVLDVGGQPAHGVGEVRVVSGDGGARVELIPTKPRWTVDRPMCVEARVDQDGAAVSVRRIRP